MSWEIPTFRQFDREARRQLHIKYNVSFVELAELYGANFYRSDWEDRVVELFDAGASFPARQWNALEPRLQRRILRTNRALKMPGNVEPWRTQTKTSQEES